MFSHLLWTDQYINVTPLTIHSILSWSLHNTRTALPELVRLFQQQLLHERKKRKKVELYTHTTVMILQQDLTSSMKIQLFFLIMSQNTLSGLPLTIIHPKPNGNGFGWAGPQSKSKAAKDSSGGAGILSTRTSWQCPHVAGCEMMSVQHNLGLFNLFLRHKSKDIADIVPQHGKK